MMKKKHNRGTLLQPIVAVCKGGCYSIVNFLLMLQTKIYTGSSKLFRGCSLLCTGCLKHSTEYCKLCTGVSKGMRN